MDDRVYELLKKEKIIQKSNEWLSKRQTMITASSASDLLIKDDTCDPYIKEFNLQDTFLKDGRCCNPYSSKNQFILNKCIGSKFKGSVATYHGQKYEDVVLDIYRNMYKTEIMDFGLLTHPEHNWLGASPDGITPSGIMLEIKCPYRRKITGIPPLYYWIQVQLQLEVCNLEYCDFVEYEFMEFMTKQEFLDDTSLDKKIYNKGAVIIIDKYTESGIIDNSKTEYIYPDRNILDKTSEIIEWAEKNLQDMNSKLKPEFRDILKINVIYWKVVNFNICRIKRSREWFKMVLPVFEKAWKEIEYYKMNDNHKHLISKTKGDTSGNVLRLDLFNSCVLTDDES